MNREKKAQGVFLVFFYNKCMTIVQKNSAIPLRFYKKIQD
ncbi:hypothetical protein bmyco0002_43690 [Bacillus pseudomycoides]|nr:hypothetical protein bmyco0002_43690 [Bacillus pseudomycoides]